MRSTRGTTMGSEGVTEEMVTEEGVEEGGGNVGECPVEGVTEEGVTDVGVGERDVETGEGARSVGVCSEGSLGLYMDGGRGMSAGSYSRSLATETGEGTDEGIVGISDGGLILISSASNTRSLSLHLQSAVLNSVDTSDAHTSAVMYSVSGGGVGHGSAVLNSVSAASLRHFSAVSYSVSQIAAVS